MSTTTVEYKDTHRVKICDLLSKIHVNKSKKEIRKEATQLINSTIINLKSKKKYIIDETKYKNIIQSLTLKYETKLNKNDAMWLGFFLKKKTNIIRYDK